MDPTSVDGIDLELLGLLREDSRRTFSDMAGVVGLSVAATKRRVDRMRAEGVITGFTAQVDHAKLGWSVTAFTELRYAGSTAPDAMLASMSRVPEVEAAYTISGDPDALVSLRVRDLAHLQQVINRLRSGGRVTGTKTLIVLGSWHR